MKKLDLRNKTAVSIIQTNINVVLMNMTSEEIHDSLDWYKKELNWCIEVGTKFGVSCNKVAGLYAAFSPMKTVQQNKQLVLEFLSSPDENCKHLKSAVEKARLILKADYYPQTSAIGNILNGLKTKAFFYSLIQENGYVAIDRHMLKLAPIHWNQTLTPTRYRILSDCVLNTAINRRYGAKTFEKQAVLWSKLKNISSIEELKIN